jgi:hypothetical protein
MKGSSVEALAVGRSIVGWQGEASLGWIAHAQITTSQRYVHWARGLGDSADHRLSIEIR